MPQARVVDIPFPLKGYDEGAAYRQQPEGTSPDCLNVRPYDVNGERRRGGQRPGLSKYISDTVNGSNAIQAMGQVTQALDPDAIEADTLSFSDAFTQANGLLATTSWWLHEAASSDMRGQPPATTEGSTVGPKVKSNAIDSSEHTNDYCIQGWLKDVSDPGTSYILKARVKLTDINGAGDYQTVGFLIRGDDPSGNLNALDYLWAGIGSYGGAEGEKANIFYGSSGAERTEVAITISDFTAWINLELRVSANVLRLYIDGVKKLEYTTAIHSSQKRVGFFTESKDGLTGMQLDDFELWTGVSPASLRTTDLVVVSGGGIYSGTKSGGLTQPASGSGALSTAGRVSIQDASGKAYFCDGIFSNYKVLDLSTFAVTDWTAATGGVLPGGGSGTSYAISNVSTGNKTFTTTAAASAAITIGDIIEVHSSTGNDRTYTVADDDDNGLIEVTETIPDSTADGSIRVVDVGCKYATLYRGRLVMWGLYTDPQNWFMSAVGNPLNWNYSPAVITPTIAVAGNNADAGKLGDVLNCCAPYSDDVMIMGGDHSLWVMRGDPAAGGQIDNISYQTGISGPDAFAWDPNGVFYFFGSGTLWRLDSPVAAPVPVSRGRMDKTFGEINLITYAIRLLWDNIAHGLHIYLVPTSQPSTVPTHYFWDQRTDSFWLDQIPAAQGPSAIAVFDADDPDDRTFLLGGWDSYIRQFDNSTKDDDGTKISSYVEFPPMVLYGGMVNAKLVSTQINLASGSDPVRIEVYAHATAEEVVAETVPKFARTIKPLTSGRGALIRQRVHGNAIQFKFIQDDGDNSYSWALESMSAVFLPGGLVRRYQ